MGPIAVRANINRNRDERSDAYGPAWASKTYLFGHQAMTGQTNAERRRSGRIRRGMPNQSAVSALKRDASRWSACLHSQRTTSAAAIAESLVLGADAREWRPARRATRSGLSTGISKPNSGNRSAQPRRWRTAPLASAPGQGRRSSRKRPLVILRDCESEFCRVDS